MVTKFLSKLLFHVAFAFFLLIPNLYGQPGTLDPTFGIGGKAITSLPGGGELAIQALVVQPDGKLVGAGYYYSQSYGEVVSMLARYNSDGTLDNSFGVNGIDTSAVISTQSTDYAAALQTDGKIVTAGFDGPITQSTQFSVKRYNANGSVDSSFGTNGEVILPSLFGGQANCIAVQKDGKILAGGTSNFSTSIFNFLGARFTLLRLNTDGKFDSSFGINGIDSMSFQSAGGVINALTIQPDGKIIGAGGIADNNNVQYFALARYNTNGTLDSSFGSNGIDSSSDNLITPASVALQNDGKIVVGGSGGGGTNISTFAVARYNTNGTLDNSFGVKNVAVYGNSAAYAMALQSDGKIAEAGVSYGTTANNFAMVRYLSNGSLDSTFGVNGLDTTNFGNSTFSAANAIQLVNSRIYLAGTTDVSGTIDVAWAIAAYLNDATALPVTYLNFNGVLRNNQALLNWDIANESNDKGFEVQRSMDGQTFTDIGFVKGVGNSSNVNHYSFIDPKILSGLNYYRLKQSNIDGRFTYSSVIKIDYSKFDWAVLGNPATNNSWLQLQLDKNAIVTVQIISINGSIIKTINKGNIAAGTYSIQLNMNNAKPGMYIVRLTVDDQTYAKKIMK